jgi:UDP-2,3-diacylglucosamine pyrophosphatase LpxH
VGGVDYYNCGDWVEHCTALVEEDDGTIRMHHQHPATAASLATAGV